MREAREKTYIIDLGVVKDVKKLLDVIDTCEDGIYLVSSSCHICLNKSVNPDINVQALLENGKSVWYSLTVFSAKDRDKILEVLK